MKQKRLLKAGQEMTLRDGCRAAGSGGGAVGEQKWVKEL
jgi:hypothetical protein